jgi:hypothetical protein
MGTHHEPHEIETGCRKGAAMSDVLGETPTHSPSQWRFELRTIFILIAVTGWAIALFVHYGQVIGLILATVVVLGAMYYLAGDRAAAIVCIVILVPLWLSLHWLGPDSSMRQYRKLRSHIVRTVGTDRLQQWAVELLDSLPRDDSTREFHLNRAAIPTDIRSIAGNTCNLAVLTVDKDLDHVEFCYEYGEYCWSVVIKRPSCPQSDSLCFDKISEGVEGRNWLRNPPDIIKDPPPD